MTARKIWFMGTGKFAALCLDGLIRRNIAFSKIITGSPSRSGRAGKEIPSPVELTASSLGLSVEHPGKLSGNTSLLHDLESESDSPDVIFVIDFGQIIREPYLSCMCLNIHPSLLPEYRGATPIQRALLEGRTYTGVTLFRLNKEMDTGDIAAQRRIDIHPDDNASDLYEKLAGLGCDMAFAAIQDLAGLTFTKQDDSRATYAPKLEKAEFALSFTMTAKKFTDTVRALDMSGGAYTEIRNKRVKIWRAFIREDIKSASPGQVMDCSGNPVISCCDFCVELAEVQSEGKNKVSGSEWVRGMRLKNGDTV